ncbi:MULTISPECIES: 7-carboxy-7-deazaguanine synthase QueE [unclassified Leptolyngbya]|uniref:7-carboxy-7-deazaguanine synthase QueE n=1 Tax=unclassified Leptolyngbya TaxID=2650499 RepID=UPI0016852632|nr:MULTISPECIES: 7-carboxy-7-deazaguanine synthase QueE [unclassified Leptolyngbya]MBD1912098.1 7-carboxy-7-deazaguanine synthase QueE [Leptolyngbya sp. FACHB-8]MBD2154989.1 7-carboxy-7-deazaguanine synthase QueE [Leptolyngbya sp. FACHB-16]
MTISSATQTELYSEETEVPVVETFHSVQGEGAWAGTSAFFIRLAGCDVGCSWCDTKQSWSARRHPVRRTADLIAEAKAANPAIAIITGGEPLMHNLGSLSTGLKAAGLPVHLETSGAHPFSGIFDWVTFSPKQSKPPHPSIYPHVGELKVVVANAADLEWAERHAAKVPANAMKLLQPEWNTSDSYSLIFDYVLRHPEWRISLQTHKFTNIR